LTDFAPGYNLDFLQTADQYKESARVKRATLPELEKHDTGDAVYLRSKEEMKMEAGELRQFVKNLN
jgi:hypothetical protein